MNKIEGEPSFYGEGSPGGGGIFATPSSPREKVRGKKRSGRSSRAQAKTCGEAGSLELLNAAFKKMGPIGCRKHVDEGQLLQILNAHRHSPALVSRTRFPPETWVDVLVLHTQRAHVQCLQSAVSFVSPWN